MQHLQPATKTPATAKTSINIYTKTSQSSIVQNSATINTSPICTRCPMRTPEESPAGDNIPRAVQQTNNHSASYECNWRVSQRIFSQCTCETLHRADTHLTVLTQFFNRHMTTVAYRPACVSVKYCVYFTLT